jgi:hypothetical protein
MRIAKKRVFMGRGVLRIEVTRAGLCGVGGRWGRASIEKEIPLRSCHGHAVPLCYANE